MNDLVLIPYIEINGTWTIPDDAMKALYRLMEKEKTAKKVFYSGTVKNEHEFLGACKAKNSHTVVILQENGHPGGIVWLNNFQATSAQIHFCMFREIWGTMSVEAGKMAVDYFLGLNKPDGSPMINVLMGATPEHYDTVISYIQKVGVTIVGRIPCFLYNYYENKPMGAVISYIERRN
jgi:hypothetical protein